MKERLRTFDWPAFCLRLTVIIALSTWLLIERLGAHDHIGAALVATIGYLILPILAYIHTKYHNSRFTLGVGDALRRIVEKRSHNA